MSAGINKKVKSVEMRKMIAVAAVVAALAFVSVFVVINYTLGGT